MIRLLWLRHEIRRWAGEREGRFRLLFGPRHDTERLFVGPETNLVVEGYPRSANTFAVLAIEGQNPGLRMAHHLHVPAQFLAARRLGIPAMLLLRDPDAAAVSYALRAGISLAQALRHYARFHQQLLPLVGDLQLARFERVTAAVDEVVAELNHRFGTAFVAKPIDDAARQAIFDEADRGLHGGPALHIGTSRPHAGRRELAEGLRERMASEPLLCGRLAQARAAHDALLQSAGVAGG